ncbi:hypothetical protein KKG83_03680 [Candidatus Micrarchaeota archaeon]|nr:hypothetical protein [Candidatus Micrarchaeota archaeon]MBU2476545.1 hypothetical protein [Candidatus Micrarchaeota archaeon]
MEKVLPFKCRCGGKMKKSHCQVEFFGLDFGVRECEVCTKCNSEYLDDEVMAEVEKEVKEKKLFALDRKITVTKSGNSLVVRIPPEIVKFSKLHYQDILRLVPITEKRIEIEVLS